MKKIVKLKGGPRGTHGGYSYLVSGRLPEHRLEVERYLTAAREGLIADLAGTEERMTTAQLILIGRVIGKLGVLRCIEEYIRERSIFEAEGKGPELAPCLGRSYLGYSNSLRLDLQALGLAARAEERVLGPLEIAAEIDREKEAAEKPVGEILSSGPPAGAKAKERATEGLSDGSGGEAEGDGGVL